MHRCRKFNTCSVSGEAERILAYLPIINGNYVKEWNILNDRYDHQRFLANTQLKNLFNQPTITQERSDVIKELLDKTIEIVHSLKSLEVPVEHWDAIVVFIIVQKLPS